jgi:ubiquinol-cytochrome c reductase iron-sulfur subunit
MGMDRNRRLVNYSLLALTGTGVYFTVGTMFKSLEPPKKALLDAATFIDTSALPLNEISYFTWQKKPLFILKKDASMTLDQKRDVQIGEYYYTIMVGICTHLGCIPKYYADKKRFICPCHNGQFDHNGNALASPVSKPLVIPPFAIRSETIIVGEVGEAYLKLMEASKA